ncbi:glycosyltransferase [Agathobacter rectalis]|uniref:Glycosyltransferase n=1 Tax=Agathobacter rectalis TaxID=39491 RepID=A0A3E4XEJ3_9FIRM|nr:glycosyltransferase family 4 protein [Agathobacter rectalis]RGM52877.1 glycosyltransferase [Agathobacter rectalis]
MKILYFMNHVDQGGAALALYDLIKELKDNYDDIVPIVVTGKKNGLNKMLEEIGVENYSAQYKNFMSSYKKPEWIYRVMLKVRYKMGQYCAIKRLEKIIDFSEIDIIHSNLNRIDIGAILAQKYKIPHIWHIREHGDGSDFKLTSVMRNPIRYMNSFNSYTIMISNSVEKVWELKGLNNKKMRLIYDGVRTELYNIETKQDNRNLKMIFMGGYDKNKGQEDLIDALKTLPEDLKRLIQIDFFGNGSEKYIKYLKNKIYENGLEKVMKINSYQHDIWKHISDYDIGLNCSHGEGFGRVTVEYMMAGLCPIASDRGATPEIIENGITGIIYDSSSSEELKNSIIWALNNRKAIRKMGIDASEFAKKEFSMSKHAREIRELYYEVIKENG